MKKLSTLVTLLLSGCAIFGPSYSGNTTADYFLKFDTEMMINTFFRAEHNCIPGSIYTEIIEIPKQGNAHEIWTATGCNHTEKFDIYYIADPKGGTYLSIKPIKQ
ncbi:hypothetical protein [Actinobacillus pleuropneumoniae]|uniref:hypothetical protein n=1 Tax=Actinobacillus pleuropneumoniae TaxID=715 RepID=UPI003B02928E